MLTIDQTTRCNMLEDPNVNMHRLKDLYKRKENKQTKLGHGNRGPSVTLYVAHLHHGSSWSYLFICSLFNEPITGTARSKAWTVFGRSNIGIVGPNPTRVMDVPVRLFCVSVVLCVGTGLATGWSQGQDVLPTVYRLRNWKSDQGPQGL
jgi:hypothetical protein